MYFSSEAKFPEPPHPSRDNTYHHHYSMTMDMYGYFSESSEVEMIEKMEADLMAA